jgi:hypothetical protein
MKGNQGLEALAALCGGASQAVEEPDSNRQGADISGNEGSSSAISSSTASSREDSTAILNSGQAAAPSQLPSQQWQQYLASQSQGIPNAFSGVALPFAAAPNSQNLQQMAFSIQGQYQAFMQAHAAQMAQQYAQQQMQQQQQRAGVHGISHNFIDPAAVAALAAKDFSQGESN